MASIDALLQAALGHGRAGRSDQAEALFRQVLQRDPDQVAALNNLGTLLLLRGELAEAQTLLERAIRLRPDHALAHNNLGSVWLRRGQFTAAVSCFAQALAHRPDLAVARYNLGTALHRLGRLPEAEAALRDALRLQPDYAPAHYQLGVLLKDVLRLDEARACLERAIALEPDFSDAQSTLAAVLQLQGRTDSARAVLARAIETTPSDSLKIRAALLLPVIYPSLEDLERERSQFAQRLEQLSAEVAANSIADPAETVGATPFFLAYQGKNDRDLHARLATIYRQAAPTLDYVAPHCRPPGPAPESSPIRVGFLSSFFFGHSVGKLTLGLLRHLSRTHFAVTLLRFPGPDDALARALDQAADRVVTLPRNLAAARELIAGERLDALYYADIGMDPWTYFLAFARLAPVQCASWGHPVTTGIPTIDYFLSSSALEPDHAEAFYTEALVRFDKINTYYYEPKIEGPYKDRAALGLGTVSGATLYVCPQSLFKIHPEFDPLLGAILRGDPRGRVILTEGVCPEWTPLLAARLRRTIGDEAGRVVFLPRLSPGDFLHLLAAADVVLDTPRFGGGNTSLEAFAFGTPIVTLEGDSLRDRITSACYRQMGLSDQIARSGSDYVQQALRLGTDPAWRDQVRRAILARKHLLFEDAEAVRQLERFLLEAVAVARGRARARTGA
jgi:predicted O-linked N-acetylglucosamine transferase (SPINDLY family)